MNRILVYRSLVIVFFLSSIFSGKLGAISNQRKSENAAVEVDGGILVTLPKNEYNVNAQITRLEKDGLSLFFVRPSGDDCLPTDKKNKFSISYGNSCKMYARWTKEHFFLWLKKPGGLEKENDVPSDSSVLLSVSRAIGKINTSFMGDSKPIDIEVCSLDEVAKGENSAYLTNVTISRETYDPKCELSLNFGSEYKLFKPTVATPQPSEKPKSSSSLTLVYILVPIFLCGILLSVVFTVVWCIYKGPSKKKSESEELPTHAPTATDVTAPEKVQQGLPKRVTKTVAVKEPSDKSVPKPITELLAAKAETTNTTDGPKTTISMTDAALSEKTAISSTPVSVDEYMDYDEPTRQRMHRQDAREKYIKQLQKYGVQAVGKIRSRGTTEEEASAVMKVTAIVSGSGSAQSEAEIAKRRKGIRDQYEVIPVLPINKSPVKEGKKSRKTSARNEVDATTQGTQHSEDATQSTHESVMGSSKS